MISVVERLYTNQLRRVTKCYNGVFASLRKYEEAEGTAPEVLQAHTKLLMLIPKMLMTRMPFRKQGPSIRYELSEKLILLIVIKRDLRCLFATTNFLQAASNRRAKELMLDSSSSPRLIPTDI